MGENNDNLQVGTVSFCGNQMASSRRCGQCERDQEGTGEHPGIGDTAKLFAPRHEGVKTVPLLLGTLLKGSVGAAPRDSDTAKTSVRGRRWSWKQRSSRSLNSISPTLFCQCLTSADPNRSLKTRASWK